MTRNAPEPASREADTPPGPPADALRSGADVEEFDHDRYEDAELEDLEDDEERERQKARSALVGLIALVVVLALTGIGVWTAVEATSRIPDPGISRQLPAQP